MRSMDWIALFKEDRESMSKIMRENAASDLKAGYSMAQIARQMIDIERYEAETERLTRLFESSAAGQELAHKHLKKVGAIA